MKPRIAAEPGERSPLRNYALAAGAVAAIAGLGVPLLGHLDLANIVMLFPLAVLFAAIRLGRGPAVLAALLSVLLFDVLFVPPRFTLVVSDLQYVLTFAVLLVVALITAELAARLRHQRDVAEIRGQQAGALYEVARELSAALTEEQIAEIASRCAKEVFAADASLMVPNEGGELQPVGDGVAAGEQPEMVAQTYEDARTRTDGSGRYYVPLVAPMRVRGVLVLTPRGAEAAAVPSSRLLATVAGLLGIALERIHFVSVAHRTTLEIESERLRNSLLAALSHDLRTPLTAIAGLADTVSLTPPRLSAEQAELVQGIRDEALRTGALVHNLLDMARFQSGGVRLRREWQPMEELVGAALQSYAPLLMEHRLVLDLPEDLPMVEVDSVLMERVVCNLVENAVKYTPPGSHITIEGRVVGAELLLSVCDDGPGLPAGDASDLFGKFVRGRSESTVAGVGLGLSIVDAIVKAHGGRFWGRSREGGGACFCVALPLGNPPAMEELHE